MVGITFGKDPVFGCVQVYKLGPQGQEAYVCISIPYIVSSDSLTRMADVSASIARPHDRNEYDC